MALLGEDKEIRLQGSLAYDPRHVQPQEELTQREKSSLNGSGGSKSKTPISAGRINTSSNKYRECLKNHAANVGGNVTDGCGEFMPSGEEGTIEALKCAACHCHRNFHRKEPEPTGNRNNGAIVMHQLHLPPRLPSRSMYQHLVEYVAAHNNNSHGTSMVQPVKLAFGGGSASTATDSSSDQELNFSVPHFPPQIVLSKKRCRTKFSQEQKDKMLAFAEKLGWRIPREDDTEVQRFCAEVGVKRQVFKVWMHNNKNYGKKINPPQESQDLSSAV